ncbi:MAG: crossover junction endodeoxyribonuclease RuvC, partial [Moorella sp. (in: Bacteria)]|nr:crossover junction endodeoxyribonuclease RuvC [Moorella sp. (in: firmicutes)]
QRMVQNLLGLESRPEPDDVADALAVAICHASFAPWRREEAKVFSS